MSDTEKDAISKSISSPTTTPFSINDILTKNNTSVLKVRHQSSGDTSPISQKSRGEHDSEDHFDESTNRLSDNLLNTMKFYKHPYYAHLNPNLYLEPSSQMYSFRHNQYKFIDNRPHRSSSGNPSMTKLSDLHYQHNRTLSSFSNRNTEDNDRNNNTNSLKNRSEFRTKNHIRERRQSLDCFLVDTNHNNNRTTEVRTSFEGSDKTNSCHLKMNYYNFPVIGETPLDMRRCISESGLCTENAY